MLFDRLGEALFCMSSRSS